MPLLVLQIAEVDLRDASSEVIALLKGAEAVFCTTGTTAFPSSRWEGGNGPRATDFMAVNNLIAASPANIKRFVLVTSAGVERTKQPPWFILNTFGVLKYKRDAELALLASGLPFTIIRPGRLTDGPYTSFDLNTLLQATAGNRKAVNVSPRDDLDGETSRIVVAEACLQAACTDATLNKALSIQSTEGDGPGEDSAQWSRLFTAVTQSNWQ